MLVGKKITDHITLAYSHQRLAEESRRTAALRERAANLAMLDDLLQTLVGVLDVREVFDRISAVSQTVLEHDALSVSLLTEDSTRVRIYASSGFPRLDAPVEIPIPDPTLLTEPWTHRLVDDLASSPLYSARLGLEAGMQSVLLMPIRLEGRLYGSVNFFSRLKGQFAQDDVMVGRRIADHVALALAHQKLSEDSPRPRRTRSGRA